MLKGFERKLHLHTEPHTDLVLPHAPKRESPFFNIPIPQWSNYVRSTNLFPPIQGSLRPDGSPSID